MGEYPEPQPATAPPEEPSVAPAVSSGDIQADVANIVGTQNFSLVVDHVEAYFDEDRKTIARRFSDSDVLYVTDEREEELQAVYAGDTEIAEQLFAELDRERVLFLAGERGVGKQTTALYLAARIAKAHRFERSTAVIKPLDAQVHFELSRVTTGAMFQRRVVVFDDVLAKKNASLVDFFGSLERVACDQMVNQLQMNQAYLVFTAASADAAPFRQQLGNHLHVRELGALSRGLVEDGFSRKMAWIARNKQGETHMRELTRQRQRVIDKLPTLTRLASFIDFYIKRNDADLDAALHDFFDRAAWFTTTLATDFDAWCFALALVLAQAPPQLQHPEPVAWLDFERLRRAISERLKADRELFPPSRNDDRSRVERGSGESLHDEALRNGASIRIDPSSDGVGHVVQFNEPEITQELWTTLLTRHRRLLTAVIPALRTIAEQERAAGRLMLRAIAAQALGRIGEIDPERITFPLIRHWATSTDRGPLVGRVLQGALGSAAASYRQRALREVDALTMEDPARTRESQARLLTAIVAYAQIAVYEPGDAMEHLGAIVIQRIAPAFEESSQAARSAAADDRDASVARSKKFAEALRKRQQRLGRLALALDVAYRPAIIALGRAVAQICILKDAVKTLTAMRDWISQGGPATGVVVAMLFLRKIVDDLDPQSSLLNGADGNEVNPLLFSLASGGKSAASQMAAFLADVYASVHGTFSLTVEMQHDLLADFTDFLSRCAGAAVANGFYRRAVEDLFVLLGTVRGGRVRNDLYTLLATPAFDESDEMRSFAVAVRKRLG